MSLTYDNLADSISEEIMRVSAIRQRKLRAAHAAGARGVDAARATLYLMDQAMHFARKARDEGEEAAMAITLRALKDIRDGEPK